MSERHPNLDEALAAKQQAELAQFEQDQAAKRAARQDRRTGRNLKVAGAVALGLSGATAAEQNHDVAAPIERATEALVSDPNQVANVETRELREDSVLIYNEQTKTFEQQGENAAEAPE